MTADGGRADRPLGDNPLGTIYLEYYGQLREAGLADQDLFDAMVTRYPDWVSRQQFLILG